MKLAILLAALLALAPFATADQDIQQGPLTLRTTNYDQGQGCGGDNGSHQRAAEASAEYAENEKLGAYFQQSCSDYGADGWEGSHRSGSLTVARTVDNNAGPNVGLYWMDNEQSFEDYHDHMCYTMVYVSGIGLALGCLPAGAQWPLAPTLP